MIHSKDIVLNNLLCDTIRKLDHDLFLGFNPFIHGRGQLHNYVDKDLSYGYTLSFDGPLNLCLTFLL